MDQHDTDDEGSEGFPLDGNGNYEITYRGLMLPKLVLEGTHAGHA